MSAALSTVLAETARQFGVTLNEAPFTEYLQAILTENEAYGLTAFKEAADVERQLLADSLSFFQVESQGPVADLGSGAGIPGIPIALAAPHRHVTLVEARQRKAQFLSRIVDRLKLRKRVRVAAERAEAMGRNPDDREKFGTVVAKGLAQLPVLLELAMPLLEVGGVLIAWKGPGADEEIAQAESAFKELHATLEKRIPYTLPQDPAQRQLLIIRKTAPTPEQYPRRSGKPKKTPL